MDPDNPKGVCAVSFNQQYRMSPSFTASANADRSIGPGDWLTSPAKVPNFYGIQTILIPMTFSPKIQTGLIRADIQSLRTIAVSLVVLFHLWPNRMPGGFVGVDVFFVISGFLITRHLLHEANSGHFSVTDFWARRIKRLLPASFLVLCTTGIAVALLAPISQWSQWFGEIQAALFYFENWNLAGSAVDYLALANQASPVQHFWSLSVEEQFYFVWPLVIALAVSLGGPKNLKSRIFISLVAITLMSLGYGVFMTDTEPAIAYFSTPVRAWEFGAGALVCFAPKIRGHLAKNLTAVLGLLLIGMSALVYDTKTTFPGIAAVVPVLGTVLVIAAAVESGWIFRVLAKRPFQWIGDKSYAIYLWHWPVLILATFILGNDIASIGKFALLAITLLLSWLTHSLIEKKVAALSVSKWKIFSLVATTSVLIATLASLAIHLGNQKIESELQFGKSGSAASAECFGAAARSANKDACATTNLEGIFPPLAVAASDIPKLPDECFSVKREQVAASFCALGDRNSNIKFAAVGDSHLAHFAGALNAMALRNHWQIDMYAKGGCPFSYGQRVHDQVLTKSCPEWVSNVVLKIRDSEYRAIVTSQRSGVSWVGGNSSANQGLIQLWQELVSSGQKVIAIKDNPNPGTNAVTCLLSGDDCLAPRAAALPFDAQVQAAVEVPQVLLADFDDVYCDKVNCLPIIGNVVVYRDDNHLTDTFARTLGPLIEPYLFSTLK
jgi:peptidoglycan/LPS O-acetylase OafA/YrhL